MRDTAALADAPLAAPATPPTMTVRHMLTLVLVTAVWGINISVIKIGLTQLPPIAFVALRFLGVAVVLLPFVRLQRRHLRPILALSFTLGTLHFPLSFIGLKGVDASTAAIAIQLQVPFAALLAAIFFKESLGWRRLLGMAIAFAGVVVIAGEPRLAGHLLPLATVVVAACIWAFASVQIKLLGDEVGVLALNAWVALLAVPQLVLISWIFEDGQIPAILRAGWEVWASVAYQAAVIRAAITLKLCTYEDSGAVLAALTTSIPESAGSGRNWDYRYCWLRDSFFVIQALNRLGATRTMEGFRTT